MVPSPERSVAAVVEPGSPPPLGDPGRTRQLLRNLLTNAEKFGGFEVRLVVAADAHGNAAVRVEDNGAGLPDDEWECVFEPYYRFHEAAGQPDSVGIGLAISRRLARSSGREGKPPTIIWHMGMDP